MVAMVIVMSAEMLSTDGEVEWFACGVVVRVRVD